MMPWVTTTVPAVPSAGRRKDLVRASARSAPQGTALPRQAGPTAVVPAPTTAVAALHAAVMSALRETGPAKAGRPTAVVPGPMIGVRDLPGVATSALQETGPTAPVVTGLPGIVHTAAARARTTEEIVRHVPHAPVATGLPGIDLTAVAPAPTTEGIVRHVRHAPVATGLLAIVRTAAARAPTTAATALRGHTVGQAKAPAGVATAASPAGTTAVPRVPMVAVAMTVAHPIPTGPLALPRMNGPTARMTRRPAGPTPKGSAASASACPTPRTKALSA